MAPLSQDKERKSANYQKININLKKSKKSFKKVLTNANNFDKIIFADAPGKSRTEGGRQHGFSEKT